MLNLTDIHPLTDFLRNAKEHLERLRTARRPELLTVNGKAAVVVQDAASYQELLERVERAETLAGIQRGIEAMKAGKMRPVKAVLGDLKRAHR
jgi:hypothetical protein